MQQSINVPITDKNIFILSGTLHSGNLNENYGSGSVMATVRRILSSDAYIDFKTTIGFNRGVSVLAFKRLSTNCNGQFNCIMNYKKGKIAPVFVTTLTYQLDKHVVGQIRYKTGINFLLSSMKTILIYEKDSLYVDAQVNLNLKNSYVGLSISRMFFDNDIKLKASTQYGYTGLTVSYGIEKQVTKFTRLNTCIVVNSLHGVILNLEIDRGLQQFIIPVVLSNEVLPSAIFYGTIAPVIGYYVVKKLIIDPYVKERDEKQAKLKQERLKAEIAEKRRLALAAQNLMKEAVNRVIEKEGPSGLIITRAFYGKLSEYDLSRINPSNLSSNEKLVDVTIPLQFLVINHSLQVLGDQPKSLLEGFYDPCIGEQKSLYIEYTLNGELYEAQFDDNQLVRLPKVSHKKQWWSMPFSSVRR